MSRTTPVGVSFSIHERRQHQSHGVSHPASTRKEPVKAADVLVADRARRAHDLRYRVATQVENPTRHQRREVAKRRRGKTPGKALQ